MDDIYLIIGMTVLLIILFFLIMAAPYGTMVKLTYLPNTFTKTVIQLNKYHK